MLQCSSYAPFNYRQVFARKSVLLSQARWFITWLTSFGEHSNVSSNQWTNYVTEYWAVGSFLPCFIVVGSVNSGLLFSFYNMWLFLLFSGFTYPGFTAKARTWPCTHLLLLGSSLPLKSWDWTSTSRPPRAWTRSTTGRWRIPRWETDRQNWKSCRQMKFLMMSRALFWTEIKVYYIGIDSCLI